MADDNDDDGGWRPKRRPAPQKSGGYAVGKGKPPVEHRFKPGNKGGGRTPGSKNRTDFDKLLDEKITIGEDRLGRPIRKSKRKLVDLRLINKAVSGDLAAIKVVKDHERKMIALKKQYGPPEPDPAVMERKMTLAESILDMMAIAEIKTRTEMMRGATKDGVPIADAIREYRANHGLPVPEKPEEEEAPSLR